MALAGLPDLSSVSLQACHFDIKSAAEKLAVMIQKIGGQLGLARVEMERKGGGLVLRFRVDRLGVLGDHELRLGNRPRAIRPLGTLDGLGRSWKETTLVPGGPTRVIRRLSGGSVSLLAGGTPSSARL